LHIPRPNIFIPSDFEYLPIDDWKQTYPKIIRDNSLVRVWWKQDTEFRKPKSVMTVDLKNPTVHIDPLNWNLTHIFAWLLEDYLAQQLYEAGLAGLDCKISVTTNGIRIYIEGFSDKQNIFLETILNSVFRYKIDPIRFSDVYDSYYVDLKSFKSDKPQQVAIYYLSLILTEQTWSSEELIKHIRPVTMKRLESFIREVFSLTHAECFMFGNVNEAKALELSKIIEKRLDKARTDSKTFIFVMTPTVSFISITIIIIINIKF
jgi:insulysin